MLPRLREFLLTLVTDVIVTGIIYFFTMNLLTATIALVVTTVSVVTVYYLYRTMDVVTASGLKRTHKDSPDPTPLLKKYFESSKRIRLLAIRGARMMGTDRSLINYVIGELPKSWNGRIEVLLLDPDSPYLRERAEELGHNPAQFATECRSAIQNISRLKKEYGTDIEVRVYSRKPVVRAIIFDDRALLSYYIGGEGHIPIQYEITAGDNSLLRMLNLLYDELWNESKAV